MELHPDTSCGDPRGRPERPVIGVERENVLRAASLKLSIWIPNRVHQSLISADVNDGTRIRSTRDEWEHALEDAARSLGIMRPVPNYAHVFLEALRRPRSSA